MAGRLGWRMAWSAVAVTAVLAADPRGTAAAERSKPNIVVILADDLGYGDVSCYNPDRGKIATPHIDALAAGGMRFTDAHSSSGVCSPSRYTLLTGRYHWRSRLQKGIVGLWERPLIADDRLTLAGMLRRSGYATAAVGKWHLGWDWAADDAQRKLLGGAKDAKATGAHRAAWAAVFAKPIAGGPTARGFDTYFGTDVPNWPPFCWIENDRTVGIPTEYLPAADFKDHRASQQGPALEGWSLEAVLPALGDRAAAKIGELAAKDEPYFLYLPLTSPHTPIAVNEPFKGKSGLIPYADLVMETDAVIGRVLAAIEASGEAESTLVVMTSDNGCAPYIGADAMEAKGHYPSGPLRGYKGDAWEGGHRVAFIVRWPGVVKAGAVNGRLVQQADLMATCAAIVGYELAAGEGEDSVSILPILRGVDEPVRETAINQSRDGLIAIRRGEWKLIFGKGSGGWGQGGDNQPGQLYHLGDDLGETKNLYAAEPQIVSELTSLMERLVREGRSTPGEPQTNDVPVSWNRIK